MVNVDEAFAADVTRRLEVIEDALAEAAIAGNPFVTEAANHIIAAGGKRVRPLLVVLGAHFGGEIDEERLTSAAIVCELTHVASLYHDDVMDEAELRRGAASANVRYGNNTAILVGDFLFARASSQVSTLGVDYVARQAETFARLVQGQIAETLGPAEGADPVGHYLSVLSDKTGSLIATSAVFGGMVAGASPEALTALENYGEQLGLVFQLSDDLLDIVSTDSGKQPGTDLREGVHTMPTLLLAASDDPADDELKALIAADLSDDANLSAALDAFRTHRIVDAVKADMMHRAEVAKAHLAPLPDGPAKQALIDLCDGLVERTV